jgi:drug/metabolite transporter (DMT)-like permease
MGDAVSLFFITAISSLILLPFVNKNIGPLLSGRMGTTELWVLLGAGLFSLTASLFDFEALRIGKIAIIEPIYAIEIIGTLVLTGFAIGEWLTFGQTALVLAVTLGIILVSLKSLAHLKTIHLERGITYAFTAALFMAGENFLMGYGSRLTNPLLTNWTINMIIMLTMFCYLIATHQIKNLWYDLKAYPKLIFSVSIADTIGWVAFAYSTTYIPIGLAVGISEAYIVLAVLLGLFINKEKLKHHQLLGACTTVTAAIILAYIA